MIQGKRKAITFSYDDGVFQDKRLLKIFNEYGLKGTFNLNSGLFENRHPTIYNHICITEKEATEIYRGHELAVHTLTHPLLTQSADDEIIRQVEEDRKNLERIGGEAVVGMAYPCGPTNEHVKEVLAKHTKIQYARTAKSTHAFKRQTEDLLSLNPTVHHLEDCIFDLAEEFLNLDTDEDSVFYIWGHSYEFDHHDAWGKFEKLCKMISGKDDIAYITNKEIYAKEI